MYNTDSTKKQSLAIVVTGYIGMQGTAILAKNFEEKISGYYPAHLAMNAKSYDELVKKYNMASEIIQDVHKQVKLNQDEDYFCEEISTGGVLSALWNFAKAVGTGYELDLRKIPIKQETIEICELLEVNPYHLCSFGAYLIATPISTSLQERLNTNGIPSIVVGSTNETKAHILNNDGIVSHVNRPEADELVRLGL